MDSVEMADNVDKSPLACNNSWCNFKPSLECLLTARDRWDRLLDLYSLLIRRESRPGSSVLTKYSREVSEHAPKDNS